MFRVQSLYIEIFSQCISFRHCILCTAVRAKKSHELQDALSKVYSVIDNPGPGGLPDVPLHLKTGGGKVGAELGWGEGYSHDLSRVRNIQYMPRGMENIKFL